MLPLGFAATPGLGFGDGTVICSISTLIAAFLAEGLGSEANWSVIRTSFKPENRNQQMASKQINSNLK